MLHEIKDYKFILCKLLNLDRDSQSVDFKQVRTNKKWREITKISNGESCKSRIYYQYLKDTKKYEVSVSDKDDQTEDIKKL